MVESLNTKKLTVDEFSRLIQNCRDLYEAVVRNGYYLPKLKTTMITEDYMRNVISGKAFCPKYAEIKTLPCPNPRASKCFLKSSREFASNRYSFTPALMRSTCPTSAGSWTLSAPSSPMMRSSTRAMSRLQKRRNCRS